MNTNLHHSSTNCRTMHCVALSLAMAMPVAIRAHAQCYIDPVTGQRVCTRAPGTMPGARAPALDPQFSAPALDPRLSTLDQSAHCRISVGDGTLGSGTLVGRNDAVGLVITCAHLFDDGSSSIIASFPKAGRFNARLVDIDHANDLAALVIRRPEAEPLNVCDGQPTGLLAACGFGPDGVFRGLQGPITGQAIAAGATYPSTTIACAVRPGDSGGAVLNTRGQLVGVVWGQRDGQTYATCGRPVFDFFNRVRNQVFASPRTPTISNQPTNSQPPALPGVPSPSLDLKSFADELDARIRALDAKKQDRGDYLQHGDLNGYLRTDDAKGLTAPLAARSEVESKFTALSSRFESIHSVVETVRNDVEKIATVREGFLSGTSVAKVAVGALGLSGPLAAAMIVAGGLTGARAKRTATRLTAQRRLGEADRVTPSPVAVDSPPPPQRTIPETHYVPIEKDSFAKAHQWASEHVARKYPGATEVLQAQDSLIKQFLAGK